MDANSTPSTATHEETASPGSTLPHGTPGNPITPSDIHQMSLMLEGKARNIVHNRRDTWMRSLEQVTQLIRLKHVEYSRVTNEAQWVLAEIRAKEGCGVSMALQEELQALRRRRSSLFKELNGLFGRQDALVNGIDRIAWWGNEAGI